MSSEQWGTALQQHYGVANLAQLQNKWLAWVREGSPAIKPPLRRNRQIPTRCWPRPAVGARPEPNLIYRGQSIDPPTAANAVGGRGGGDARGPAASKAAALAVRA